MVINEIGEDMFFKLIDHIRNNDFFRGNNDNHFVITYGCFIGQSEEKGYKRVMSSYRRASGNGYSVKDMLMMDLPFD